MLDKTLVDVVTEAQALPAQELFELYLSLPPERAHVVALAVRDKARAGGLQEDLLPALAACIEEVTERQALAHLAKAAAAFGRTAVAVAPGVVPALAAAVRALHVADDVTFWILDGCLWSLAYAGGPEAAPFLRELAAERPSRALHADSVYAGKMACDERERRFQATLEGAMALALGPDPGPWREKKTKLEALAPAEPNKAVARPARNFW